MFLKKGKIIVGRTPLKRQLHPKEKIGYLFPPRLGDTLIGMVTAHNLQRNGFEVELYGDFIFSLKDWFPQFKIHQLPTLPIDDDDEILKRHDTIMCMCQDYGYAKELSAKHNHTIYLWQGSLYKAKTSMVDIQLIQCKEHLNLQNIARDNGIMPLPNLIHRQYKKRIMIHPTSSKKMKNWPAEKFIKLVKILTNKGYEVFFIVPQEERALWEKIIPSPSMLPNFSSLSEIALWIYESNYFIGNDSGMGHLASCLGIPTLSIISRSGMARMWRPAWGKGIVVTPTSLIPSRKLKEKIWKHFVSVKKVAKEFIRISSWV